MAVLLFRKEASDGFHPYRRMVLDRAYGDCRIHTDHVCAKDRQDSADLAADRGQYFSQTVRLEIRTETPRELPSKNEDGEVSASARSKASGCEPDARCWRAHCQDS